MNNAVTIWIVIIALILIFILLIRSLRRKFIINRWYRNLDLDKHHTNHQKLFVDIDGFTLSRQARLTRDAMEYTYGEIDFISFIALLSLAHPNNNTVFYDLGSGTGKAVLACAMVFNVKKCCGIELFTPLHAAALKQQQRLQLLPYYQEKAKTIHWVNADFLNTDFSDATLIFLNSTAFFGDTWAAVSQRLTQTKLGTIIITTSKKLSSNTFIVKKIIPIQMSWGLVNAYIQQHVHYEQINKIK